MYVLGKPLQHHLQLVHHPSHVCIRTSTHSPREVLAQAELERKCVAPHSDRTLVDQAPAVVEDALTVKFLTPRLTARSGGGLPSTALLPTQAQEHQ